MGRCWTGYASIVGRTRPIPLSRGEGVEGSSSHATTTYHCWVWLGVLKMPLGKYVDRLQGGAECELGEEQAGFIDGDPSDWVLLPQPDGAFTVGIDGGYVRNWCDKRSEGTRLNS